MKKAYVDEDRFEMAKLFSGIGVEIGVADGTYSGHIMFLGKVEIMSGVDPYIRHRGYVDYTKESTFNELRTKAHQRLGKYPNYKFIEDFSINAANHFLDNSLDFVYIDGDHSYKGVMEDITTWLPKVKPGGIIAGDDYIRSDRDKKYYDVINAVDDYVEQHNIPWLYLFTKGRNPTNWMFYK